MRRFSFAPALTLSGRTFNGLRGFAGKPFHPPLTDVPVTAYLFAAAFDVVSLALGGSHPAVARQLFVAGTWTLLGGTVVALLAALTGWADWHRSSERGTQARRTINAHAIVMIVVSVAALADLVLRGLVCPDAASTPVGLVALSVLAGALVCMGASIGGTLVFDYGFNVETAGDSPVWHHSEVDVRPGGHDTEEPTETPTTPAPAPTPAPTG